MRSFKSTDRLLKTRLSYQFIVSGFDIDLIALTFQCQKLKMGFKYQYPLMLQLGSTGVHGNSKIC